MSAAVSSGVRPTVERDDLDDIFNYDAGIDATFNRPVQDWNAQDDANNTNTNQQQQQQQQSVPIDIDEEIKVTKKRKPVAKLDEDRLLSQQGIPKLRKIAKDRIQIKGKGHEFSDMAHLLNTYQLWLDDLFPKAKFMDGVSMIEKLGHKKRIQMMRREWIQEGKPKPPREDDDGFAIPNEDAVQEENSGRNTEEQSSNIESMPEVQSNGGAQGGNNQNPSGEEEPDEDELDALLAESEAAPAPAPAPAPSKQNNTRPAEDQEPDEDELDALMAEDAMTDGAPKSLFGGPVPSTTTTNAAQRPHDEFDDDEEAMAGMDW